MGTVCACVRDARDLFPGGEGRRLRRAVDVQEPPRSPLLQNLPDPFRLDRFAAEQKMPQPAEGRREFARHVVEEGRRQEQTW